MIIIITFNRKKQSKCFSFWDDPCPNNNLDASLVMIERATDYTIKTLCYYTTEEYTRGVVLDIIIGLLVQYSLLYTNNNTTDEKKKKK